ncbi:MAG TPA: sulfur transferase domain-containing protein [Hyphomonadaceae bacterium]|jgi:uncharacterized protein (TIGR01244 family)|nr:sulfur transferase domain-containing protein [Hyphomonadaceae bacterium]
MRSALLALALAFAAPAFADTPIKFPEKVQRTDFQAVIADVGPAYVAGQPTEAALRELVAKEGIKTVINLRTQQEMDNRKQVPFDEAAVLKELGVNYVHIPLGGPDTPYTPEAVEKFAKAFEGANTKVLLHCTVAWRASHMWAAYLVKHKGVAREEAVKQATAINFGGYPQGGTPLDGLLGVSTKPGGN